MSDKSREEFEKWFPRAWLDYGGDIHAITFKAWQEQQKKIEQLEELVNELSNKKDKLLEILTLAVCNFGTSYYGKIYNMAVKTIQKENRDKTWEDIKAEVKQKNDING